MEVELAKCAGFCFGVQRAVETVYEQLKSDKTIYTYGPIVHNEEVVEDLAKKGVKVLETKEELMQLPVQNEENPECMVVIRAHGVPKEIYDILEKKRIRVVDATCPFVKRIHNIVEKESLDGKKIVIIGNPVHPEVEGILGWCNGKGIVLEDASQAQAYEGNPNEKLCIVAQTTYNYKKFQYIVEIFQKKGYNDSVVNTICSATEERQLAARELAGRADVMIVIGGKHSSNTRKLYEICLEECKETYYIQTLDDLHLELPKAVRLVGITAGASTPNKLIEEVQNYVRINF